MIKLIKNQMYLLRVIFCNIALILRIITLVFTIIRKMEALIKPKSSIAPK